MEGELLINVLMFVFALFLLLIGWLVRDHHSDYPDTFSGYHVGKIAAKSREAWEDANRWCGGILMKAGAALLPLNIAAAYAFHVLRVEETCLLLAVAYLMLAVIVPTVLAISLTEIRLKRKYDAAGRMRREKRK